MKPAPFTYHRAESAAHAAELLAGFGDDGRILAGGQSLLPMMGLRLLAPKHLVDISRTADLATIESSGDGLIVGAAATYRSVARHRAVDQFKIIGTAIGHVGHEPIRNRGTVVGSIAHNDPAGELPAVALVLGAEVRLRSARGSRSVSIDDFLTEAYSTTISDDELVESVRFPQPGAGTGHGFSEYSRRPGDYALPASRARSASAPMDLSPDAASRPLPAAVPCAAIQPRKSTSPPEEPRASTSSSRRGPQPPAPPTTIATTAG